MLQDREASAAASPQDEGWLEQAGRGAVLGRNNLPNSTCVLVPNRLDPEDLAPVEKAVSRKITFFAPKSFCEKHPALVRHGRIKLLDDKFFSELASLGIRCGTVICLIPEAWDTRPGTPIYSGVTAAQLSALAAIPVVPLWIDRLWGSLWPKGLREPVSIAFGKPLDQSEYALGQLHQRFLELGELSFRKRPGMDDHLGRATIRGLRKSQFSEVVIDGMDHRRFKGGTLLAASIALSRWLKRNCAGKRVAVVLPPGAGAVIANIAVVLADKIPVNLNFTAGRAALGSAIQRGEIGHAISAKPVMKRLQEFPWPPVVYRLEELVPELKSKIVLWRLAVLALPSRVLSSLLRLPRTGQNREAVLLFTSGTAGEPKGVVLSHRNILGNVLQFRSVVDLHRDDTLMASLPFFHCFGCTVTLWHPVLEGVRIVTYPTPVDVVKNAELVERYKVTLMTTTPTFLRGYLKRCEPKQFATVKLLVAGAEKLPRDLAENFRQKFGIPIMEGYGLTETSPVVSVNLPEPVSAERALPSARAGSVGKLLPGQAAQIRDADSGKTLAPNELGILWLKGANIFESYLNEPGWTQRTKVNDWFRTGDLARFDEDGFLYIEGRLSRFSKIAGEMVPHEAIEAKIIELFGVKAEDEQVVTVVGVPNDIKGEVLVLLSTYDLTVKELRDRLLASGFPTLWIPRTVKRVDRIPVLGTGKLDLGKCLELARSYDKPRRAERNPP